MFRDRTDRIGHNPPMKGYGAAVTSGRDGPAAFVAGFDGPNRLYAWEDGRLVDRACGILTDETRSAIGVVAADFDADGREEIYVHNTDSFGGYTESCDLLLDRVDTEDRRLWCDVFALGVNGDRPNFHAGRSVAAIDRYGTGRYGAFVACYGAPSRFYELGDDGELTDMASAVGLEFEGGGRSVVAGPIVSDGMDLFVGVEGGPNRLFANQRGHFVEVARQYGLDDPGGNARGGTLVDAAAADFGLAVGNWGGPSRFFDRRLPRASDGSGIRRPCRFGRYLTERFGSKLADRVGPRPSADRLSPQSAVDRDGPKWLHFRGDADDRAGAVSGHDRPSPSARGFVDRAPKELADADGVRTVLAADFDNDGRQELFVNAMGASNRLFRIESGRPVQVPIGDARGQGRFGTGATVADFDGDGTLELLVVHGELDAAPLSLYAVPNDNRWLRVRPTTQYGAPARGAVVTLETDRGLQQRVIDAGSGYLCQAEPVAHFGLGREGTPRRIEVTWPDGREITIDDPAACKEIEVPHPIAPRF